MRSTVCCSVYVLSTNQVHTKHRPSTYCYILVKVLEFQVRTSMYSVGTLLHQYTTCYRTVPPCSALHRYIPPCNACHNSEDFFISIWCPVHPDLHSANRVLMQSTAKARHWLLQPDLGLCGKGCLNNLKQWWLIPP
jgi:hypothetical protein